MRRRDFITGLGGATVWASGLRAQAAPVPVVGFLHTGSEAAFARLASAFREGLSAEGYVEGRNVAIEYRWANDQYQQLPELARDLARRQVAVIAAAGGVPSARAVKAATTIIPTLFITGVDPVRANLVASINSPDGNATGVSLVTTELTGKRLELLRELAPNATTVAMLVNSISYPSKPEQTFANEIELKETAAAARRLGLTPLVFDATVDSNVEVVLNSAVKSGADALFVSADPGFTDRRAQIVALAGRLRLPAIYPWRLYAESGGLMSYGPIIAEAYRQIGRYAGRILNGTKPKDLPVQQPMTFELVINRHTAELLGLPVSPWLLARADEVIE